ncbi:MAG: hydantoinase/oxoprolinase family protein [Bradymonadaceae bacterium]
MTLGVDTGGTFTDLVLRGDDGELRIFKLLSTPDDPSRAIGEGYDEIAAGEEAGLAAHLVHGTTVSTNALLERDGAEVAFVATEGFADLLHLQRQNRPALYEFEIEKPTPLVDRGDCFEVDERLAEDGSVLRPVDDEQLEVLARRVDEGDYDAVAVCLLHAYADDSHEEAVAAAIEERSDQIHVSTSSDVGGEFREYERASTTTVNAYLAPVMQSYLDRLDGRVGADRIEVMQSNGGRVDVDYAADYPVHTVLSGPAGGVVGARTVGRELGRDRVVSLDMGGTSADVGLCDGSVELASETEIDGLPIRVPVVDLHTVGAGGGSIARVDPGGGLRVGPESAGADPGPACYGRGGDRPTVTDAHVVLGRIRPGRFLGGRMELDPGASHRAVGELADEVGMSAEEAARGILEVADASMVRALKVISLERGHDPRDFSLVAFGGAGGLHACRLADALDMPEVIVPRDPGVLSAYGMLHADFQRFVTRSILAPVDDVLLREARLRELLEEMEREAVEGLDLEEPRLEFQFTAQLRYEGQSFEIDVPVGWAGAVEEPEDPRPAFERRHEELYGYRAENRTVQLVGIRLAATVPGPQPNAGDSRRAAREREPPGCARTVEIGFRDDEVPTTVVDRRALEPGDCLEGPAIVTEYTGTTAVPPGWAAEQMAGHLVLRRLES